MSKGQVREGLWFGVCNMCRQWRPLMWNYWFDPAGDLPLSTNYCLPCYDVMNHDEEMEAVAKELGIDLSFNPFAPPVWILGSTVEEHEAALDLLGSLEPITSLGIQVREALTIMGWGDGNATDVEEVD